jgi:hypothetical protein
MRGRCGQGWSGLVRFWLVPYLFMHFQMGTFHPVRPYNVAHKA